MSSLLNDKIFGALLIEPIIQGAGGMQFIDPLFQNVLVKQCRDREIPIIFDEGNFIVKLKP